MEALFRVTRNIIKLNIEDIADKAIDKFTLSQIVDLNTDDQLFEQGIDSKGLALGEYSDVTIEIKKSKGQRIDHITLKDTGEFYSRFKAVKVPDGIELSLNPIRGDSNLVDDFGEDIQGLTDQNLSKIINEDILPKARIATLAAILK